MRKRIIALLCILTMMLSGLNVYAKDMNSADTGEKGQVLVAIGDEMFMVNEDELSNLEPYSMRPQLKSLTIQLVTNSQKIPSSPLVGGVKLSTNGQMLYRLKFSVKATLLTGGPAVNYEIAAVSRTTSVIQGMKTVRTDASGTGYIEIDVRGANQYILEAHCENLTASTRGVPQLGCSYESTFRITGYIVADEGDYSGTKQSVPGLSEKYAPAFIAAVKMNGSGKTLDNKYIKYAGNDTYMYYVPITRSGTSPTAGQTIAVDPDFIPLQQSI